VKKKLMRVDLGAENWGWLGGYTEFGKWENHLGGVMSKKTGGAGDKKAGCKKLHWPFRKLMGSRNSVLGPGPEDLDTPTRRTNNKRR